MQILRSYGCFDAFEPKLRLRTCFGSQRGHHFIVIATFFIPIVGLIVGGFYALNDDPDKSGVGKGLIIFGLVMLIIGFIFWNIIF